jgi:hypothetical protein
MEMKLTQHSEYRTIYLSNNAAFERCRDAVTQWKVGNDTLIVARYALQWTYESARSFILELSQLFQEYNRVLWEMFHYCRQCGGQCCVTGASHVRAFDLLAIALLDRSVPLLSENVTARERQCIYLSQQRCSWPEEWRTIKCWSFYCLGVGPWQPGMSLNALRHPIIAELQRVVHAFLPVQLRSYEAVNQIILTDYLDDPVRFAEELQQALFEIFVSPLNEVYSFLETQDIDDRRLSQTRMTSSFMLDDNASAFLAEAVEQICENQPEVPMGLDISTEQLLEDLEMLVWVVEGHPAHEQKILTELYRRYANAPAPEEGVEPTIWYLMRDFILNLSHQRCKLSASPS